MVSVATLSMPSSREYVGTLTLRPRVLSKSVTTIELTMLDTFTTDTPNTRGSSKLNQQEESAMHKANEVVNIINKEILDNYGVEVKKAETPSTTIVSPSRVETKAKKKAYIPKVVTQPGHYSNLYPSIKTPSSWGTPIVDAQLSKLATMPTLKQNNAEFEKKEYDQLINVVLRQMCDVLEGAGFVFKGKGYVSVKQMIDESIREHCLHRDEKHIQRYITVKGEK